MAILHNQWDHPRVCGEHACSPFSLNSHSGSSPRMRGTLSARTASQKRVGIIPAYAGNTASISSFIFPFRDHPRVCGEHLPLFLWHNLRQGSSPRMRGTRASSWYGLKLTGIIPAYAGNTSPSASANPCSRDHPRVCGEHCGFKTFRKCPSGSSPRMRGTLGTPRFFANFDGIIPAYAGNTYLRAQAMRRYWDHPRVCGEHLHLNWTICGVMGSSPRMRGTLLRVDALALVCGIIPAYAGNTLF